MTTDALTKSKQEKPGLIARVAERTDAQIRLVAEKLHKLGYIYALYAGLDGLSLSSSMFIYATDVYLNDISASTSDFMHDWMMTPEGLLITVFGSAALIAFSVLANHFQEDDKNALKSAIALLWPYIRDMLKALKNAYKGWRATMQLISALGGHGLNPLIVPIGVLLGSVALLNRLFYRWILEQRKSMMKSNADQLEHLQQSVEFTLETILEAQRGKKQSTLQRGLGFLLAAGGGAIDGLYLYVGVLGLTSLMPPVLAAMAAFTALYVVACVITRVYEEYDFQRKLIISQAKIDLAICGKTIELLFDELQVLSSQLSTDPENQTLLKEQACFIYLFEEQIEQYKAHREKLRSLSTFYFTSAFLSGAKNGLAAYGALASLLFGVATILVLTSTSFPPALLIASVSLGMAFLIGFITHSLINAYLHREKQAKEYKVNLAEAKLSKVEQLLEDTKTQIGNLKAEEVRSTIQDGMVVDGVPQWPFQEWFEVIRSFFSGIRKGTKAISLTMNPFEEADAMGHYHETPVMVGFMVISACVHALVLALRAFCRAFGRPPIDAVEKKDSKEVATSSEAPESRKGPQGAVDVGPDDSSSLLNSSVPPRKYSPTLFSPLANPNPSPLIIQSPQIRI